MEKKKIIFVDTYNSGPDYLDPVFDGSKVELAEVFTFNGIGGVNVSEIGYYSGWDYAVITFLPNRYDAIKKILTDCGVPANKCIYISREKVVCENLDEFFPLFTDAYSENIRYALAGDEYRAKIMGDYVTVTADGLSYINRSSDMIIMREMHTSHENFAKSNIEGFHRIANRKFNFSKGQDLFCDLGANIGTTCIYVKKKLEDTIKILAFEPSHINYKLLKINMLLNDIEDSDVILANYALSDKKGVYDFEYNASNPGGSSLLSGDAKNSNTEKVNVISFDEYVEENDIDIKRIKYIWIDVEGFEPDLFKGAKDTLSKINVPVITEFSPEFYRKVGTYKEFCKTLGELFSGFIIMQEEPEKEHDISELPLYENADYQMDIMLIK